MFKLIFLVAVVIAIASYFGINWQKSQDSLNETMEKVEVIKDKAEKLHNESTETINDVMDSVKH